MDRKQRRSTAFLNEAYEDDDLESYQDDDLEDILLEKKVSKNNMMFLKNNSDNYDSDDQVMEFNHESDENLKDTDARSDISESDNKVNLPNKKAWGKNKKSFFSTDYVDADYDSVSKKDIIHAELEEQEAKNLQRQLVEKFDEKDYGLDFEITDDCNVNSTSVSDDYVKINFSTLSQLQKQELLHKANPEFAPLIKDLQDLLLEGKTLLAPFLELSKNLNCKNFPAADFMKNKYDLALHYCVNIFFYMILKTSSKTVSMHPVISRLAKCKKLLTQLESNQEDLFKQIKTSFSLGKVEDSKKSHNSLKSGISVFNKKNDRSTNVRKMRNQEDSSKTQLEVSKDDVSNVSQQNSDKSLFSNENNHEVEKRAVTYQIAKNKGLTPFRKKEQRNPRVKHRNAYRKAIIHRKGAVRDVRKENVRYGGELFGVKASVLKSIKFK